MRTGSKLKKLGPGSPSDCLTDGTSNGLAAKRGKDLSESLLSVFDPPRILALGYLIGTLIWAVLAFRNFTALAVTATLLLFAAVPLGLVFHQRRDRHESERYPLLNLLLASISATLMFIGQMGGLVRNAHAFSNFPNQRIDQGGGFHQDSAFHVAIIQGILGNGYPTTGQHEEPFTRYHTLSHYVDAVALTVLGLDAWESYALFFVAKGLAITLALVFFASRVAAGQSRWAFWVVLLAAYLPFTNTWHVISSHGQWFPMLVLVLTSHWVAQLLVSGSVKSRDFGLLTALVLIFSFGKVSIGFGFALFVGFWLLLRNPRDWRIYALGGVWVSWFAGYQSFFSDRISVAASNDLFALFDYSWAEIFSLFGLAAFLLFSGMWGAGHNLRLSASALSLSLGVLVFLSIIGLSNPNDVFYFLHGLYSVGLLLAISTLFSRRHLSHPPDGAEASVLRNSTAALTALLLVTTPVSAKASVSPFVGLDSTVNTALSASSHTYAWWNETKSSDQRVSIKKMLMGGKISLIEGEGSYLALLKSNLHALVAEHGLEEAAPVLFLTQEQLSMLQRRFRGLGWDTGLLITASTGMPLVFGVIDPALRTYGFSDYGPEARTLRWKQADEKSLCRFDRPVIVMTDLDSPRFDVQCLDL